jgi:Xaa-Pro dipeptidase
LIAHSVTSDPVITLFIPDAHPADLMWSIPPPTISEALEAYDVADVLQTESLCSSFSSAIAAAPGALIHTLPRTAQFPQLPLFSSAVTSLDAYLLTALHRARLTKSDAEIQRIRRANEISSRAHEVVMRVLGAEVRGTPVRRDGEAAQPYPPLPGEWLIQREAEAEAVFVASCRREGYAIVPPFSSEVHADDQRLQCCTSGILADRGGIDARRDVALLLQ